MSEGRRASFKDSPSPPRNKHTNNVTFNTHTNTNMNTTTNPVPVPAAAAALMAENRRLREVLGACQDWLASAALQVPRHLAEAYRKNTAAVESALEQPPVTAPDPLRDNAARLLAVATAMLAYIDVFHVCAITAALMIPLVLLLVRRVQLHGGRATVGH